jgi:hypothetical protein
MRRGAIYEWIARLHARDRVSRFKFSFNYLNKLLLDVLWDESILATHQATLNSNVGLLTFSSDISVPRMHGTAPSQAKTAMNEVKAGSK